MFTTHERTCHMYMCMYGFTCYNVNENSSLLYVLQL